MTFDPLIPRALFLAVTVALPALAAAPPSAARPAPDKQMQAVLDELGKLGGKPIVQLPAAEARKQPSPADAVGQLLVHQGRSTEPAMVAKVEDRAIDGAAGKIPARVYWPEGNGPFPVVLYIHGGGWVIATIDTYDASARALTKLARAIVVSVEYRKGPEDKFPAAHEDSYAAWKWTLAHAAELKGDPRRIAVAGESAGGNLALNVSIRARDEGAQMPLHQLLVYPIAGNDLDTESYRINADARPLNKAMMKWFFEQYLGSVEKGSDPRISILNAKLDGLPSTTLITAEIDPLRSEGRALAKKLEAAGVKVDARDYTGVTHEFFGMGAVIDKARDAEEHAAKSLRDAFRKGAPQARTPTRP